MVEHTFNPITWEPEISMSLRPVWRLYVNKNKHTTNAAATTDNNNSNNNNNKSGHFGFHKMKSIEQCFFFHFKFVSFFNCD